MFKGSDGCLVGLVELEERSRLKPAELSPLR